MPLVMVVDEVIQVTANCFAGNQFSSNVFNFKVTASTGIGVTDLEASIAISTVWAPKFKALLPVGAGYWGLKVQIIKPTRRPGQYNLADRGAGTVAGDIAPTQTCGLIKAGTNSVGPRYRAKNYIAFPGEGSNTAAADPSDDYKVALDVLRLATYQTINLVSGAVGTCTLTPIVYSRKFDLRTPVTSSSYSAQWATLRRRASRSQSDAPPG